MTRPVDPARCPLCDQANDCQIAAGHDRCWCFETPVPAGVLARVPIDAQGVACVCRRCATSPTDHDRDAHDAHDAHDARRRLAMRWTRR